MMTMLKKKLALMCVIGITAFSGNVYAVGEDVTQPADTTVVQPSGAGVSADSTVVTEPSGATTDAATAVASGVTPSSTGGRQATGSNPDDQSIFDQIQNNVNNFSYDFGASNQFFERANEVKADWSGSNSGIVALATALVNWLIGVGAKLFFLLLMLIILRDTMAVMYGNLKGGKASGGGSMGGGSYGGNGSNGGGGLLDSILYPPKSHKKNGKSQGGGMSGGAGGGGGEIETIPEYFKDRAIEFILSGAVMMWLYTGFLNQFMVATGNLGAGLMTMVFKNEIFNAVVKQLKDNGKNAYGAQTKSNQDLGVSKSGTTSGVSGTGDTTTNDTTDLTNQQNDAAVTPVTGGNGNGGNNTPQDVTAPLESGVGGSNSAGSGMNLDGGSVPTNINSGSKR